MARARGEHELQLFVGAAAHGKARARGASSGSVAFDEINSRPQLLRAGAGALWYKVSLRGDTRVLTLRDTKEDDAAGQRAAGAKAVKLLFEAELKGLGVSLVRSGARELAYLRLSQLRFDLRQRGDGTTANIIISDLRLDNQDPDAKLPSVLIRTRQSGALRAFSPSDGAADAPGAAASGGGGALSTPVKQSRREHKEQHHPFLQFSFAVNAASESGGGGSRARLPLVLFLLDEVEVQLEEAFLISLYQFAGQLRFARARRPPRPPRPPPPPPPPPPTPPTPPLARPRPRPARRRWRAASCAGTRRVPPRSTTRRRPAAPPR